MPLKQYNFSSKIEQANLLFANYVPKGCVLAFTNYVPTCCQTYRKMNIKLHNIFSDSETKNAAKTGAKIAKIRDSQNIF